MKITDVTVDRLSSSLKTVMWDARGAPRLGQGAHRIRSRDMALVRVHTDEGLVGIGEAGLFGAPATVQAIAIEHRVKPLLLGEDPFYVEHIWQKVYGHLGRSGRRGFLLSSLSGVDMAIWDIIGKALDTPLYKVLGASRDRVPAYACGGFYAEGKSTEDLAEEMASYVDQGFRAVKMKIGGLQMALDVARVKAVRRSIGDSCRLMVDANNMYSPKDAIRMAHAIQEYDITWFEEPVNTDDIEGSAHVVASIEIPVAGYETEDTRYGYRELIARRAVDIAMPDVLWSGGITECRRMAALAAAYNVPSSAHGGFNAPSLAAGLHLLASLPHGGMLEMNLYPNPFRDEIVTEPLTIDSDGNARLPEKPGLGVELDEDAIARYRV